MESQIPTKTCSLCNKPSAVEGMPVIHFGEWISKKDITVHYYCLLLSTHLPQTGEDHCGILGFRLRDIRLEITMAKKRKCKYCFEMSASIQCATCKEYFHLICGHTSKCLSQFIGEFKSYCHDCVPVDQFQMELYARKPPRTTELCYICAQKMGANNKRWIYAKCCGNGFTHSKCMKIYALSAGYYLTCIWCKDKAFREDVKYRGIFVPDRDANWEREKRAYGELYQTHKRCDMEICNCPKGRDYINAAKWQLIVCKLCGAFGAHNPACLPGMECSKEKVREFKCDICSATEQTLLNKAIASPGPNTNLGAGPNTNLIDSSLYVSKDLTNETKATITDSCSFIKSNPIDGISQQSVVNCDRNSAIAATQFTQLYFMTQSPQNTQQRQLHESVSKVGQEESTDNAEDDAIADLIVQKMLDAFHLNI